ncbi:hypothetical protein NYE67_20660 [Solibacillus sp. FSL W8-0474]|uniref:hypothetical protein n=1 Tax=Solibacillus sp. FSL W8-0474 TaxID=2975336 RepID=UPI0030F52C93
MTLLQVNAAIKPELKKRLQRYCFEEEQKQYVVIAVAIEEFLTKHGYTQEAEEE